MQPFITLSLAINIAVLLPVCGGLALRAGWANAAYGPTSPARGILLSVYLAIMTLSCWLILHPDPMPVAALLAMQVIYKLTTPITVGTLKNPVVVSNLVIAAVHLLTLSFILQSTAAP